MRQQHQRTSRARRARLCPMNESSAAPLVLGGIEVHGLQAVGSGQGNGRPQSRSRSKQSIVVPELIQAPAAPPLAGTGRKAGAGVAGKLLSPVEGGVRDVEAFLRLLLRKHCSHGIPVHQALALDCLGGVSTAEDNPLVVFYPQVNDPMQVRVVLVPLLPWKDTKITVGVGHQCVSHLVKRLDWNVGFGHEYKLVIVTVPRILESGGK
mmetsp:Transcript_117/g.243  ORF Transcript_117/g.243 Transcript_117/m.243 type:complete len:208 (+) Transcript_117:772-1395(+)